MGGEIGKMLTTDPILKGIIKLLREKHHCHTAILYGSRARGDATKTSDYDVMGVIKGGTRFRIAKKQKGTYLDIFIFPEKELRGKNDRHLYMKEGVVLFEHSGFGSKFIKRLEKISKKDSNPLPRDEIAARRVWAKKMLERAERKDIEGNFRRTWLQFALLEDYFLIRRQRYLGPKQSLQWLKKYDLQTYNLFQSVLKKPTDLKILKKLVEGVVD